MTKAMSPAPVVYVDNDPDDAFIFTQAFDTLACGRELLCFADAKEALRFLEQTPVLPLVIVSDLNMPGMDGLEFRQLLRDVKRVLIGSVPFYFLSTSVDQNMVARSQGMAVQGLFTKPSDFVGLSAMIKSIIDYCESAVSEARQPQI